MAVVMNLSSLALQRGGQTLFSGLDCTFNTAEIVVVLGPNGAGKSSFLLALAGLIPAEGNLELLGRALSGYHRDELSGAIAWQGELPPTEFGITVSQRLALAAAESEGRIEDVAAAMDITALLHRALGELSSGERQRTELAALMLRDAPVWLLDEPTAHLDLKHQIQTVQMIREQRSRGRAIVTVLHDLQQAMAVADRLILIDGKGGALFGEAKALFETARLGLLFDAPLIQQGELLVPDYGVGI